jgi:hypothetical protein
VPQGDVAGGIKFMAAAIERDAKAGNAVSADIGRLCLAETYMEILGSGRRPPYRVIVRNLFVLIRVRLTGWKTAVRLLCTALENRMFNDRSQYRARIQADLGILFEMKGRRDEAREFLRAARPIAEELGAGALLARIDFALGRLRDEPHEQGSWT